MEVIYKHSLFKKMSTISSDPEFLAEVHYKAKITIEVLSLNMISQEVSND